VEKFPSIWIEGKIVEERGENLLKKRAGKFINFIMCVCLACVCVLLSYQIIITTTIARTRTTSRVKIMIRMIIHRDPLIG
jgi:hypothetical protein